MYNQHDKSEKITPKNDSFAIRLHRAKSWVNCAKSQEEDFDLSYITLWIAFNSLYAIDDVKDQQSLPERTNFKIFISHLIKLDDELRIENLLWNNYSSYIRLLIDNRYVFKPFWESLKANDKTWRSRFDDSRIQALKCLAKKDVKTVLSILFDRLYCLRNQLMHGGATYKSSVNRSQVKDGSKLLMELLPIVIEIMEKSGADVEWGEIAYPVVKSW